MQKVDLYQPILHVREGLPPLTLRVAIQSNSYMVEGGSSQQQLKPETYVLISALPKDLQERVKTAVQTIIASM